MMLRAKYLDGLPDALVERYAQVEAELLSEMARRIAACDGSLPVGSWQDRKMRELIAVQDEIIKRMGWATRKSKGEVRRLFEDAGAEALWSDDAIYKAAGKTPIPLKNSRALLGTLNAGIEKFDRLCSALTKTTAKTATKQFENALDRAYLQIVSGGVSREAAIRNAVKDLSKQGMGAMTAASGRVEPLEAALRRTVVTGVNQTVAELQMMRMDEMGCDLVTVSAHAGARPDHAAWQGKQYSRSGKDKRFPPLLVTRYGYGDGLCGWNCRHSISPFDPASAKLEREELERMNAKTVACNGKKMTAYEADQQQRYIERQIRRWKRENQAMEAAGLDTTESAAKIKKWNDAKTEFCRQTGRSGSSGALQEAQKARSVEKNAKIRYNSNGTIRVTQKRHGEKQKIKREDQPNAVVETLSHSGKQIDRTIYDKNGIMKTQIHGGDHGNPKMHPYGKHGEHAHDYSWDTDGKCIVKTRRELTEEERSEFRDMLR